MIQKKSGYLCSFVLFASLQAQGIMGEEIEGAGSNKPVEANIPDKKMNILLVHERFNKKVAKLVDVINNKNNAHNTVESADDAWFAKHAMKSNDIGIIFFDATFEGETLENLLADKNPHVVILRPKGFKANQDTCQLIMPVLDQSISDLMDQIYNRTLDCRPSK